MDSEVDSEKQLLKRKTVDVAPSILKANVAMRSIGLRNAGEDWKEYSIRLMKESGAIEAGPTPTDDELRNFNKKQKDESVSNSA